MKKSILYLTLLLITNLCVTACGGSSVNENPSPSSPAVQDSSVSESAISENQQDKNTIPSEIAIKNPYYDESEATFIIKNRNSQEYQAEINLCVDHNNAGDQPEINWELYLEMADEIKEISGATIISHEGTHYIIRGKEQKHSPDSESDEYHDEFIVSFNITASYQKQIHEPDFCFFSKELWSIPEKKYDCQFISLKKDGKKLNGIIRLSNRSEKKLTGWELKMDCNFKLTSLDGNYASYGFEYYTDHNEDRLWCQNICGIGKNFDLNAGETKEISFTGLCPADKPKLDDDFLLLQQYDADEEKTWGILERRYGSRYGKMDKYLTADTVWGTDLLFVFDEKREDGYTATAELTNIFPIPLPPYEDWDEDLDVDWDNQYDDGMYFKSIADWEIYLECADTIEGITGAEIVSHEGNVYCIRAADPNQWIDPYSFTTFQVKVSCPAGIHPLGKSYLKRAKTRLKYDSDSTEYNSAEEEQEFSFDKDDFQYASGPKWLSYYELYDPLFDPDYFESPFIDESKNFHKRQAWGKKMGRMPK